MSPVLVDSNVLLDIATEDEQWLEWSADAIARCGESRVLVINPLIYAEVSVSMDRIEDLDDALPAEYFRREALPWDAAFLAGKVFLRYQRAGGARRSPLPDFYIGAHAAVLGYADARPTPLSHILLGPYGPVAVSGITGSLNLAVPWLTTVMASRWSCGC